MVFADCSVTEGLEIVPGKRSDYDKLKHFHYRAERLGVYAAIFCLKAAACTTGGIIRGGDTAPVGVIVYTMPAPSCRLRNMALGDLFDGFGRADKLAIANKMLRCIGRVVIEPRYRGLGLAVRLVKETLPFAGVPFVEALAVMGKVNPFFEKAGMKAYYGPPKANCVQLTEALSLAGIEGYELLDARRVQSKIAKLSERKHRFIEDQISWFLQGYGKRRFMQPGVERIRYVLSRLTARPVYYVWIKEDARNGI